MNTLKLQNSKTNIVNIGTTGGQTKPSSGYTFNFIHKHSKAIIQNLLLHGTPIIKINPSRFSFYDKVMLNIYSKNHLEVENIFRCLFENNDSRHVLRFLDNESNLLEEIQIIHSLPIKPFLKAAIQAITRKEIYQ